MYSGPGCSRGKFCEIYRLAVAVFSVWNAAICASDLNLGNQRWCQEQLGNLSDS